MASVLVVASQADRRESIASALSPAYSPVLAESGADGLKRLASDSVDGIVIDLAIKDIAVPGLVEQIRTEYPSLPIVLTGEAEDSQSTARAFANGANNHVVNVDQLLEAIEDAIAKHRADQALDEHRRLSHLVRDVSREVTALDSREAIERVVYDRMMATDLYQVVSIGEYTAANDEFSVHVPIEGSFPSTAAEIPAGEGDDHVLHRAIDTMAVATADVPENTRSAAAPTTPQSGDLTAPRTALRSAAIPFVYEGSVHGVALVSSSRAHAFDASERSLLDELGAVIGFAIWRTERESNDHPPSFVENLVHELRSPLGIAMAHLDIGRERDDPESFERVAAALEQMETLIDDLSSFTPLEGIEVTTERDLAETADEAWADIEEDAPELEIEDSTSVSADHDLLERLLSNLFRNAVEHAGPDVTVRIGTTEDGFYIEDNGSGIPETEQDQVFERGYTNGGGLGIGLSLVEEIVDAHGWSIQLVESSAGGARFEVSGVAPSPDDDGATGA